LNYVDVFMLIAVSVILMVIGVHFGFSNIELGLIGGALAYLLTPKYNE